MQHHVAVTAFHLHHPAFQLIATAGSMTRTARKAYRHHSRYTYLYHNKHQLHKFRSVRETNGSPARRSTGRIIMYICNGGKVVIGIAVP